MVFRFIIYTLLIYLGLWLIRRLVSSMAPATPTRRDSRRARAGPSARSKTSRLVRCARCGMFIAESKALLVEDAGFCSRACAEGKTVHRA
jgi:hypothetical protein